MVVGIIGESCTGKSTLADKLKSLVDAEVYTGKDYLRLARRGHSKETFSDNALFFFLECKNGRCSDFGQYLPFGEIIHF